METPLGMAGWHEDEDEIHTSVENANIACVERMANQNAPFSETGTEAAVEVDLIDLRESTPPPSDPAEQMETEERGETNPGTPPLAPAITRDSPGHRNIQDQSQWADKIHRRKIRVTSAGRWVTILGIARARESGVGHPGNR